MPSEKAKRSYNSNFVNSYRSFWVYSIQFFYEPKRTHQRKEKLRKQLLQLEEENNNLKLSIKEWEGLMPFPEIGEFWVQGQLA